MTATATLRAIDAFRGDLRDGFNRDDDAYVRGFLEALRHLNLIEGDEHYEDLRARINRCPGHNDGHGRQWCAYCGDLECDCDECQEEEPELEPAS